MENETALALPKGAVGAPRSTFPVRKLQPGIASFQHFKTLQKSSRLFKTMRGGHTGPRVANSGSPRRTTENEAQKRNQNLLTVLLGAHGQIGLSEPCSVSCTVCILVLVPASCTSFSRLSNGNIDFCLFFLRLIMV